MHRTLLWFLSLLVLPSALAAQNVSNYRSIPDPFLFLIREPAVHKDLRLTPQQQQDLTELNEEHDPELLATRNMQPEQGMPIVERVMETSRRRVGEILNREQLLRLRQIAYRLRGISFVLEPEAADALQLTESQRQRIQSITTKANQELTRQQKRLADGKADSAEINAAAKRVQTAEQRDVIAVLSPPQRQQLKAMVGRAFDPSQLGRVSFKAPEIADSEHWVNSAGVKLSDLRGKVVALHFWAFG